MLVKEKLLAEQEPARITIQALSSIENIDIKIEVTAILP